MSGVALEEYDENGNLVGSSDTRDLDDAKVEALLIVERAVTRFVLTETDWYILESAETGEQLPQEVQDLRASIRAERQAIRDLIDGATTLQELDDSGWTTSLGNLIGEFSIQVNALNGDISRSRRIASKDYVRVPIDINRRLPFSVGSPLMLTRIVEDTLGVAFPVGRDIYMRWAIPRRIDRTAGVDFSFSFFPQNDGVGRIWNFELGVTARELGSNLEVSTGTIAAPGVPLPDSENRDGEHTIHIDGATYLPPAAEELKLRLTRTPGGQGVPLPVLHGTSIRWTITSLI